MTIAVDKLLQQLSKFTLIVLVTICLTRIWAISLYYVFGTDSQFTEKIVNDPWHHYQFGLVLIGLGLLLHKLKMSKFLPAIGLGIFFEEWSVFLNDLGLNTKHLYGTKLDFIIILALVGSVYILSRTFYSKASFKNA